MAHCPRSSFGSTSFFSSLTGFLGHLGSLQGHSGGGPILSFSTWRIRWKQNCLPYYVTKMAKIVAWTSITRVRKTRPRTVLRTIRHASSLDVRYLKFRYDKRISLKRYPIGHISKKVMRYQQTFLRTFLRTHSKKKMWANSQDIPLPRPFCHHRHIRDKDICYAVSSDRISWCLYTSVSSAHSPWFCKQYSSDTFPYSYNRKDLHEP